MALSNEQVVHVADLITSALPDRLKADGYLIIRRTNIETAEYGPAIGVRAHHRAAVVRRSGADLTKLRSDGHR